MGEENGQTEESEHENLATQRDTASATARDPPQSFARPCRETARAPAWMPEAVSPPPMPHSPDSIPDSLPFLKHVKWVSKVRHAATSLLANPTRNPQTPSEYDSPTPISRSEDRSRRGILSRSTQRDVMFTSHSLLPETREECVESATFDDVQDRQTMTNVRPASQLQPREQDLPASASSTLLHVTPRTYETCVEIVTFTDQQDRTTLLPRVSLEPLGGGSTAPHMCDIVGQSETSGGKADHTRNEPPRGGTSFQTSSPIPDVRRHAPPHDRSPGQSWAIGTSRRPSVEAHACEVATGICGKSLSRDRMDATGTLADRPPVAYGAVSDDGWGSVLSIVVAVGAEGARGAASCGLAGGVVVVPSAGVGRVGVAHEPAAGIVIVVATHGAWNAVALEGAIVAVVVLATESRGGKAGGAVVAVVVAIAALWSGIAVSGGRAYVVVVVVVAAEIVGDAGELRRWTEPLGQGGLAGDPTYENEDPDSDSTVDVHDVTPHGSGMGPPTRRTRVLVDPL